MARFDRDGMRIPSSIFECAAWHYSVVAICRRCARETIFDPHALWWLFERKHWDGNLKSATHRFKCTKCGAGAFLTWSRSKEANTSLPMPSAADWKRAISRFRS
ncbi:MAG: hypothetical protein E7773_10140 [Sphingomonas sp.]|uniref:hypothetical protein n=1 Tax=Sphingomonas sp. TaxID=28214 RepID=UPI00120D6013|nr:hypothetical protein [Sphingomonas sp.]THD35697.1 MAG: hypothetical protein E7773_10140 [Sphingomonas sp.]